MKPMKIQAWRERWGCLPIIVLILCVQSGHHPIDLYRHGRCPIDYYLIVHAKHEFLFMARGERGVQDSAAEMKNQ